MVLSSADAQSQKITGTLLAKPNKSITVLPNKIIGMDVAEPQKKEDDVIQPTRGFVFNKPVIQSNTGAASSNSQPVSNQQPAKNEQANAAKRQSSTFNAEAGKSTTLAAGTTYLPKPSVQVSSTPGQLIPESNSSSNYKSPFSGILKYEEPPVKKAEPAKQTGTTSIVNTKEPEVSYGLVYGPPPVPANGLKSPTIQGMYKAEPKKAITLLPVPASELEAIEQQKRDELEAAKQTAQTQTQQNQGSSYKATSQLSKEEQLQQDFNHQVGSGSIRELKKEDQLQSDFNRHINSNPEIIDAPAKNSKRSSNKNKKETAEKSQQNSASANDSKYRFAMPVKQSSTENIQSIPVGSHVLQDFEETGNVTVDKTASNETVIKSRTTLKDKQELSSVRKQADKPVMQQQSAEKKFNLPAPVVQKQTPAVIQQNEERAAARPSSSNTVTVREDNHKPVTNQAQSNNTNTISGRTDYKFYMSPNGKYTIVFNAAGSSVTVTSFGRVNDFAMPSDGGSGKPSYNYKGLIDAVGSLPLQYNYEGRVSAVGAMPLTYNYNGAIEKVGDTPITYNYNGTVDKIGNSKISYDYQGNITSMDKNALVLLKQ